MPIGQKLVWLVWGPLAFIPLGLMLSGIHVPQPLSYNWHKALHVLGVVLFLGDIVTQVVWLTAANATKSAPIIRAAQKALGWTDLWFLGPGMFLVIANGAFLAQAWGGIERWSWMLVALILLGGRVAARDLVANQAIPRNT
jgi:hypothetical protein